MVFGKLFSAKKAAKKLKSKSVNSNGNGSTAGKPGTSPSRGPGRDSVTLAKKHIKHKHELEEQESQKHIQQQKEAENDPFQDLGNGDDEKIDDSSTDPDAALKSIKNMQRESASDLKGSVGSFDRYDELDSYSKRSIRSHSQPDIAPTKAELAKRKVRIDEQVTIVQDNAEEITAVEKKNYYMQEEDFRRCDIDVELTTFRWEKAKKGKQKFDEKELTIRGLEDILLHDPKKDNLRSRHVQDVLTETVKQRAQGKKDLDWERIRQAAEKTSKVSTKAAADVGEQDRLDAKGLGKSASKRFSFLGGNVKKGGKKEMSGMRKMFSFKRK